MSLQFGFDFNDDSQPVFCEQAPGTWDRPSMEDDEIKALLDRAVGMLHKVPAVACDLFALGVALAVEGNRETVYLKDTPEAAAHALMDYCATHESMAGVEIKVREGFRLRMAAMHVEGVGSLELRQGADWIDVSFHVYRHPFFLPSYQDNMPIRELPYSTWGEYYCADTLCYAGKGVANVQTFSVNGREYLCTAIASLGKRYECKAWSLCRLEDWKGPTYNYETQRRAAETGRIERSDHRGLVVRVRGQLCVIDAAAIFYDLDAEDAFLSRARTRDDDAGEIEPAGILDDGDDEEEIAEIEGELMAA